MIKRVLSALLALMVSVAFAAGVDANKATQAELEAVKGIGPAVAGKILDERKKGNFKDWNDLVERVKGIGEGNAAKFSAEGLTVAGSSFKGAAPAAKKDDKPTAAKEAKPAAAAAPAKDAKPMAAAATPATPAVAAAPAAAAAKKDDKPAAAAADDKKAKAEADKKAKDDAKKAKADEKKAAADKPAAAASGAKK
jgi:competence protein ComEA